MKIFIKLPNWLGDAVMFTPALEILKEHYKDATFLLLAQKNILSLFENEQRAILLEDNTKKAPNFLARTLATIKLGREIKALRPEISISATSHFFSNLLLKIINSKIRIGHGMFFTHKTHAKDVHQCMKYARLVEPLCKISSIPDLKLSVQNLGVLSQIDSHLKVAIAPGAAYGAAKAWRAEHFITLIKMLCSSKASVILLGGESEKALNSKIMQEISSCANRVIDLTSKLSIQELLSVILESNFYIGNDSGPSHIAVALKTQSILIWGSTAPYVAYPWISQGFITKRPNWKINAYDVPEGNYCEIDEMRLKLSPKAIVLNAHLSCSPCERRICPLEHHNCMKEITPQRVYELFIQLTKGIH